ncbi:MAG: SDR family oxidoreductase [Hyphomonadaceae bacterium]
MNVSVLITGCNGGIGSSLVETFSEAGFRVIGVDKTARRDDFTGAVFLQADIGLFGHDESVIDQFSVDVRTACGDHPLGILINNAAVQILGATEDLTASDFAHSMNVNVIAPFVLTKAFLSDLRAGKGVVINIGSVHAQATKPEFAAYGTSKSALHGLTRALAVDLGPEVRVNTIAPAATATSMLKAGFEGNEQAFQALREVHPLKRVAEPSEIAKIALFLASEDCSFLTGATIYADGGVLSRLHDPA